MRTKDKCVVCRLNCVIHVWAPWGRRYLSSRALYKSTYLYLYGISRSQLGLSEEEAIKATKAAGQSTRKEHWISSGTDSQPRKFDTHRPVHEIARETDQDNHNSHQVSVSRTQHWKLWFSVSFLLKIRQNIKINKKTITQGNRKSINYV